MLIEEKEKEDKIIFDIEKEENESKTLSQFYSKTYDRMWANIRRNNVEEEMSKVLTPSRSKYDSNRIVEKE